MVSLRSRCIEYSCSCTCEPWLDQPAVLEVGQVAREGHELRAARFRQARRRGARDEHDAVRGDIDRSSRLERGCGRVDSRRIAHTLHRRLHIFNLDEPLLVWQRHRLACACIQHDRVESHVGVVHEKIDRRRLRLRRGLCVFASRVSDLLVNYATCDLDSVVRS